MIDTTNRNTALATALIEELARCGVSHAIASPGSRSSPVVLALDREPGIELEMVVDERSAGFVALGVALASGKPAIVACTSGSAAANLHPAVVEADQAGVPLIVLTSDRPAELRGIGAGQTIDQLKLYGDAARWFCEVGTHDADDAGLVHHRSVGCRAWGETLLGRGPVHLNLAWRDPLGPEPAREEITATDPLTLEGRGENRPLTVTIPSRAPDDELVEAVAGAIAAARRPMIVAGRQTDRRLASEVASLGARLRAPLLAEPTSQLRLGNRPSQPPICAYDLIVRDLPTHLVPDLVLRFGDMPTSKALRHWLGSPSAPDQIVIDPPGRWNEPTRRAGALVRADGVELLRALSDAGVEAADDPAWGSAWQGAEEAAQGAIDAALLETSGLSEPALIRALGEALPAGDRLLLASSMPIRDAEAFMRSSHADVAVFSNRGANGIDGLVSTAAGLDLAGEGDGATWVALGDLALLHDLGGLPTLRKARRPVRVVVIDNGGGGIFDFLPQAEQVERERFERLFSTPSDLDVEAAAALFGFDYLPLEDPARLGALPDSPRLLAHARIDRAANVELHRHLAEAVARAVRA